MRNVWLGVSVRNVLVTAAPAEALAVTVYDCDTLSAQLLCQTLRPWLNVPPTAAPLDVCTATSLRVPLAAVTVTPVDGSAWLAPLAGVIRTCAGLAAA